MRHSWTTDEIRRARQGLPTRRQFLNGASSAVGGAFMAPYFAGAARAQELGELKLLAWESMVMEEQFKQFLASKGITLKTSIMSTQDDAQVQLVGSTPNPVDMSSYSHGYSDFYVRELRIVSPMDAAKVPNYNANDIFPEFYNGPIWVKDGQLYAVPAMWGLNAMVYNPALVPEPQSYKDLLKPEYKDLVLFTEDTVAAWPMLARLAGLGDKYPNLTRDELATAFAAAAPYVQQSRVFAGSYGDAVNLFVNGEVGVLFCGWTGIPLETAKSGVETRAKIPAEGGSMWSDSWFIPVTATNPEAAYAYINEMAGPEGSAKLAKANACGTPNRKAVPLLDEITRSFFDYENLSADLANSPMQGLPPRESAEFATFDDWVAAWEEFKLGF